MFWGKSVSLDPVSRTGPTRRPHSLQLSLLPDLDELRGDASVQQHAVHQLHVTWTATHHWRRDTFSFSTNCARGVVREGRAEVCRMEIDHQNMRDGGEKGTMLDRKQECIKGLNRSWKTRLVLFF